MYSENRLIDHGGTEWKMWFHTAEIKVKQSRELHLIESGGKAIKARNDILNFPERSTLPIKIKAAVFLSKNYRIEKHIENLWKYPGNENHPIIRFKHFGGNYIGVRKRYAEPTLKNHLVRNIK